MSLSLRAESFSASGTSNITILNDAAGANFADSWQSWGTVSTAGNLRDPIGIFLLNTAAATPVLPLVSDTLVAPFTSPDWSGAVLRYRVLEQPMSGDPFVAAMADATIDSISVRVVPLPATVWLLGFGLGVAVCCASKGPWTLKPMPLSPRR